MESTARELAHTLIDFYAGITSSDDEPAQRRAFETSMARLNEAGSFVATHDDEGLTLDFTPLLVASNVTFQWLLDHLSSATGQSEEELTFELRQFIDGLDEDERWT